MTVKALPAECRNELQAGNGERIGPFGDSTRKALWGQTRGSGAVKALVAAPRATVNATAEVEWTRQNHSDVAQGIDTSQESEPHQRQAIAPNHDLSGACWLSFTPCPGPLQGS